MIRADKYDVAIIGASIAGSYAANLLVKNGFKVALIEQHKSPRKKACGEGLSIIGSEYLVRQGLWSPEFSQNPIYGYQIKTSDALPPFSIRSPRPIAWGINRENLINYFLNKALPDSRLSLINSKVKQLLKLTNQYYCLRTTDLHLCARHVFVAAGNDQLAKFACGKFSYSSAALPRFALACWLSGSWSGANADTVSVKIDQSRQFLLTPVAAGRVNVNILINQTAYETKQTSSQELLAEALNFAQSCGFEVNELEDWRGSNAIEFKQIMQGPEDLYLLGDSACRLDPISGLGMTHAILSAELASKSVIKLDQLRLTERQRVSLYNRERRNKTVWLKFLAAFNYSLLVKQNPTLLTLARLFRLV